MLHILTSDLNHNFLKCQKQNAAKTESHIHTNQDTTEEHLRTNLLAYKSVLLKQGSLKHPGVPYLSIQ